MAARCRSPADAGAAYDVVFQPSRLFLACSNQAGNGLRKRDREVLHVSGGNIMKISGLFRTALLLLGGLFSSFWRLFFFEADNPATKRHSADLAN